MMLPILWQQLEVRGCFQAFPRMSIVSDYHIRSRANFTLTNSLFLFFACLFVFSCVWKNGFLVLSIPSRS